MLRYRAQIEYDGSAYFGFQRQKEEQPTIQGELEKAICHIARGKTIVIGAGRTDSGVHAIGQVISFQINWRHGTEALKRAINANLPADIAVLKLKQVLPAFHPRFDAKRRSYLYQIYNDPVRSPVRRQYSWHVRQTLDLVKMNQAAQHLVGRKDFAAFGQPPQGDNTERNVFQADWRIENEFTCFFIEANAFLYRMVRSVVGSLKAVGEGVWSVDDFVDVLQSRDRSRSGTVAPPQGLYLVSVKYDD